MGAQAKNSTLAGPLLEPPIWGGHPNLPCSPHSCWPNSPAPILRGVAITSSHRTSASSIDVIHHMTVATSFILHIQEDECWTFYFIIHFLGICVRRSLFYYTSLTTRNWKISIGARQTDKEIILFSIGHILTDRRVSKPTEIICFPCWLCCYWQKNTKNLCVLSWYRQKKSFSHETRNLGLGCVGLSASPIASGLCRNHIKVLPQTLVASPNTQVGRPPLRRSGLYRRSPLPHPCLSRRLLLPCSPPPCSPPLPRPYKILYSFNNQAEHAYWNILCGVYYETICQT